MFLQFIVDNEHKIDPKQASAKDNKGILNNLIEVTKPDDDQNDDDDSSSLGSEITSKKPPLHPSMPPPSSSPSSIPNAKAIPISSHKQTHTLPANKQLSPSSPIDQHFQQQYQQQRFEQQQQEYKTQYVHTTAIPQKNLPTEPIDEPQSGEYGQVEKIFIENKKTMPMLPPHLKYTPLNATPRRYPHDPSLLPVPLHVTVNHAYFSEQNNVRMIGITQRYKEKFSTIVLYKPTTNSATVASPIVQQQAQTNAA